MTSRVGICLPMVDALPAARAAMGCLKRPPAAGAHAASRSICARQNYNRPSAEFNVISPYKYHGMWVFDDPRVGLVEHRNNFLTVFGSWTHVLCGIDQRDLVTGLIEALDY
jgi:hypothetical protein